MRCHAMTVVYISHSLPGRVFVEPKACGCHPIRSRRRGGGIPRPKLKSPQGHAAAVDRMGDTV
ncbi:hypothetical protein FMUAM8_35320 [Nocardia cyriacigeorgica]|nr:hypothetical protein FMUAM8_35320 [Nocardia cyriacigeorgica]